MGENRKQKRRLNIKRNMDATLGNKLFCEHKEYTNIILEPIIMINGESIKHMDIFLLEEFRLCKKCGVIIGCFMGNMHTYDDVRRIINCMSSYKDHEIYQYKIDIDKTLNYIRRNKSRHLDRAEFIINKFKQNPSRDNMYDVINIMYITKHNFYHSRGLI